MAKSIKFRAAFPKKESYGLLQVADVEFKLGPGPCGRDVVKLNYKLNEHLLVITQESVAKGSWRYDSREIKQFTYKMSDIHGRIEAVL